MLASSQPLAVQAGLSMLEEGGSAADAAVAAAAVLNVTEPTSTGIGGDCFALYYSGSNHEITALNGSGRAPAALTLDILRRQGLAEHLPPFHIHTVTVPGAPAGWCDLVERNPANAALIRENLKLAGVQERAHVHQIPAERASERLEGPYSLLLADPPYDDDAALAAIERMARSRLVGPPRFSRSRRRRQSAPSRGARPLG